MWTFELLIFEQVFLSPLKLSPFGLLSINPFEQLVPSAALPSLWSSSCRKVFPRNLYASTRTWVVQTSCRIVHCQTTVRRSWRALWLSLWTCVGKWAVFPSFMTRKTEGIPQLSLWSWYLQQFWIHLEIARDHHVLLAPCSPLPAVIDEAQESSLLLRPVGQTYGVEVFSTTHSSTWKIDHIDH